MRRGLTTTSFRRGLRRGLRNVVVAAAAAGYTPPTGATAALLDIDPSAYADINSVVDASGSMAGTFTNSGAALATDGVGAHIACASLSSQSLSLAAVPFTSLGSGKCVYAVIDMGTNAAADTVLSMGDASDYVDLLGSVSGNVWARYKSASDTQGIKGTVSDSTLVIVAASFTTSGATAYLNGSAGTASAGQTPDLTGGTTWIGIEGWASTNYFDGKIYRIFVDDAPYSATLNATLASLYGV